MYYLNKTLSRLSLSLIIISLFCASPLALAKKHKRNKQGEGRSSYSAPDHSIPAPGIKTVKINLSSHTWAAYSPNGDLIRSGRVSGGKNYCPDLHRGCRTPIGTYTVYSKQGAGCTSTKFPVGKGGAKMPYCMFFKGGYAMHGSNAVPNYNASHGCVRMPVDDARWLNQEFVNVGSTRVRISN
jgi:lipoprotein-anchoring transpeptidase ErfK/SrfK